MLERIFVSYQSPVGSPRSPRQGRHPQHSARFQSHSARSDDRFDSRASLIANLVTIVLGTVSLVQALRSNPAWILLGVFALVGLIGYWLKHRRRILAAVGIVVLVLFGTGGWRLARTHADTPSASRPNVGASSASGSTEASGPSSQSAASTPGPKLLFHAEVTLKPNQTLDVDQAGAAPASHQFALIGNADIFYVGETSISTGRLETSHGLYAYPVGLDDRNVTDSYNHCVIATSRDHPMYTAEDSISVYAGVQSTSCFITSDGHIGYLKLEGVSEDTLQAAFRVIVWDTVVSN
jgi:hypothetical protein